MVNWPRAGAMGVVGFQAGFKYRYELGSFCNRPTRTSATMRPPTGPHLAALADDLGLLQDVEPQRGLAVPSRIREEVLEALVLLVVLLEDLHHVADDRDLHLDTVVRPQLGWG